MVPTARAEVVTRIQTFFTTPPSLDKLRAGDADP
jgi:hypothetical protein